MALNSIEEIIEDIRMGKMVILMDDEDRENEGDLIIASSMIRPEDINFMARYGRGLICMTLTRERCKQLNLPLMVQNNTDAHGTNFTVSIEAAEGVTTGISAYDRAMTVRAAIAPNATPSDIVQPGHIFPLMAQPGGVLTRAGHTEAGCDLARIAGLEPSSVIVEILNEDGSMARRPDLELFAEQHGIKIGTVADLIHYRLENEPTIERVSECVMPTEHGEFRLVAYKDLLAHEVHLALVKGEMHPEKPAMVRVHLQNTLCDLFDNRRDCGWPLRDAMRRIAEEGEGVVVVLRQQEDADTLLRHIKDYEMQDKGVPVPEKGRSDDLRTYGIGAQILIDLGVKKMKVLSTPKKMHALSGFELEVTEYVEE
ncbi:MAG: bifunctional 3,4-dihydroxy-2-butanone-4-phosphate synthase/GTP cyclohydrolase II [Chromatiales bacterium]|nr:bifunctional 3,4-dihydroxy-2-butanone-4-phosphate synthase/GTP cyclohydrolase II [Chromatiales bacterium]